MVEAEFVRSGLAARAASIAAARSRLRKLLAIGLEVAITCSNRATILSVPGLRASPPAAGSAPNAVPPVPIHIIPAQAARNQKLGFKVFTQSTSGLIRRPNSGTRHRLASRSLSGAPGAGASRGGRRRAPGPRAQRCEPETMLAGSIESKHVECD